MFFHFLDTFNLMYLQGVALFHIILLKFIFWTFGFCFTDYTKHFKKKNDVSSTPQNKFDLSLLQVSSKLAIGERFDHIPFPGLLWC